LLRSNTKLIRITSNYEKSIRELYSLEREKNEERKHKHEVKKERSKRKLSIREKAE